MIINPWKAPKWTKYKQRNKKQKGKLLCPLCQKEHRTIDAAHICALEVSKYGSIELKSRWATYEAEWWARHPDLKAQLDNR